jgi:hypothetical protein
LRRLAENSLISLEETEAENTGLSIPVLLEQLIERVVVSPNALGIPRRADQHSELMSITIPKSCRSVFRTENDQFYVYSSER